jgi:hypothetical protein
MMFVHYRPAGRAASGAPLVYPGALIAAMFGAYSAWRWLAAFLAPAAGAAIEVGWSRRDG